MQFRVRSLGSLGSLFYWLRPRLAELGRFGYAVLREIKASGLDYRAMSLVYTSLLALVPLLAVVFSILKVFGAETHLAPFILETLQPLGDHAGIVATKILDAVKDLKVGVLGFLGVTVMFYTSVSMLEKMEESFNHIWRVQASRSAFRRFSDYLSFTLLAPLAVFSAFGGMSSTLAQKSHTPWLGRWADVAAQLLHALLPYLFIVAAFSLAYLYVPNAKVKLRAALAGGVTAGVAWKLAGLVFAAFVAGSAQYSTLYSSFAILVLFMIWLYVSWLILLAGVQVTFFCQHPRYIALPSGRIRLGGRLNEQLGLAVMVLIGEAFLRGEAPWSAYRLAGRLDLPEDTVDEILDVFVKSELLIGARQPNVVYLPAKDLSAISLNDIVSTLRGKAQLELGDDWADVMPGVAVALQGEIDASVGSILGSRTLADICRFVGDDVASEKGDALLMEA